MPNIIITQADMLIKMADGRVAQVQFSFTGNAIMNFTGVWTDTDMQTLITHDKMDLSDRNACANLCREAVKLCIQQVTAHD